MRVTRTTAALMVLVAASAAAPVGTVQNPDTPALPGTAWKLTHLGGKPISANDVASEPTLTLDKDPPRFSGSAGCNRITGNYTLKERSIEFGPVVATRMMCQKGMEVEAAYIRALSDARTWRAAGRTLELLDAKGEPTARFDPAEPKPRNVASVPEALVNRVWRVANTSKTIAPGTLYVFLSDGTLLVTSDTGKPALGSWKYEKSGLTVTEEGIPYRTEILKLTDGELSVRSHNPGGTVDIELRRAAAPVSRAK